MEDDPAFKWVTTLYEDYPFDIGILSPVILNLICLAPGQAMFLQAGELHAYLDGDICDSWNDIIVYCIKCCQIQNKAGIKL